MKNKVSHVLTCLLCLLLLAGFAQTGSAESAKSWPTEPGTFPVYEGEPITFKVFVNNESESTTDMSYEGNAFTKYVTDLTGVNIEWIEVKTNGTERLNMILASQDLPDMVFSRMTPEMMLAYGSQGVFLPIEDLLNEYGYFFKQNVLPYRPQILDWYRLTDGHIYSVPKVMGAYEITYEQFCLINQKWLDTLGLPMPTTTSELKDTLIAFKTMDPNGNGIADEIPFLSTPDNVWGFLMFPFQYHDGRYSTLISRDGNEIFPAFTQDGWKEGLKYMKDLYDCGLIDPECFTITESSQIKAIMLAEEPLVGVIPAKSRHSVMNSVDPRVFDYEYLPPLEGPDGSRRHMYNPDSPRVGDTYDYVAITTACKYPEIAMRFLDSFYEQDLSTSQQFGIKGEDWRPGEAGELGINGEPATWRPLNQIWGVENTRSWGMHGPTYWPWSMRYGEYLDLNTVDSVYNGSYAMYTAAKEIYAPYGEEESHFYNNLLFLPEDLERSIDLKTDIYGYVNQSIALFITGQRDIDSEWETYLKDLDAYGLDEWMQLQIEAAQRQYGESLTYRK